MNAPCTDAPGIAVPANSRSGAAQASWTTVTVKPRSAAERTVASTHMLLIIPATTSSSTPASRSCSSSGVPRKPFGSAFSITGSPSAGATVSWISIPSVPGFMKGASGASHTCLRCRTGSPPSRKRSSTRRAASAAASGSTRG
jgi:hypothetical protein